MERTEKIKTFPPKETKRERFVRIAERRVNYILDALDKLGKCSDKRNYEYSQEDVRKIFAELDRKIKETKILFQSGNQSRKRFSLGD